MSNTLYSKSLKIYFTLILSFLCIGLFLIIEPSSIYASSYPYDDLNGSTWTIKSTPSSYAYFDCSYTLSYRTYTLYGSAICFNYGFSSVSTSGSYTTAYIVKNPSWFDFVLNSSSSYSGLSYLPYKCVYSSSRSDAVSAYSGKYFYCLSPSSSYPFTITFTSSCTNSNLISFLNSNATYVSGGSNSASPLDSPTLSNSGSLIRWTSVSNADSYQLEYYTNSSWSIAYSGTATQYTIDESELGYSWRVKAIGSGDYSDSDYSNSITINGIQLDTPVLTFEPGKLKWGAIDQAGSYYIYYSTDSGTTWNSLATEVTNTYYSLSNSYAGNQFKVEAHDHGVYTTSEFSNIVTYSLTQLDSPVISIENGYLTWTGVSNATQYNVYALTENSSYEFIGYVYDSSVDSGTSLSYECTYFTSYYVIAETGYIGYMNSLSSNTVTFNGGNTSGTNLPTPTIYYSMGLIYSDLSSLASYSDYIDHIQIYKDSNLWGYYKWSDVYDGSTFNLLSFRPTDDGVYQIQLIPVGYEYSTNEYGASNLSNSLTIGTSSTASGTSSYYEYGFNYTVEQYNQAESSLYSTFSNNIGSINTSFSLRSIGTIFVTSAAWVSTQFSNFVNNNPFGYFMTFSLILGIALLMIGRH